MAAVTTTPAPSHEAIGLGLDEACRNAVLGLRGALLDLYAEVGADPERPQEVSRRFKLDKSLTWKISKVLRSDDAIDVVGLIPGGEGVSRLLNAMSAAGANETTVSRVRGAMRAFDDMVATHAGDRATLDLFLDSMHPGASMQESRRLAFLGNSGILGLQTRVRFATRLIAPSQQDPRRLDFVLVTGLRDLRRLRPIPTWPIYRFMNFKDDLSTEEFHRSIRPLESREGGGPHDWLMPSWCSQPIPALGVREADKSVIYELVEGPVGRTGEIDLTFGYIDRCAVPRFATPQDRLGQFSTGVTTPAESTLIDFFVHRSMTEMESLAARLVMQVPGFGTEAGLSTLPIQLRFTRLAGRPPQAATPLIEDYHKLVASIFSTHGAALGWDPSEFYGLRLIIEHPPLNATVLTSYELPSA